MSCFALARELKSKGFKIVFTGNQKSLENLVRQNGFDYLNMSYQTEYSIGNFKDFLSLFVLSVLEKASLLERYRFFYKYVIEVQRIIEITHFDAVFIDAHLYQYYFYLKSEKYKMFLINTKLKTSEQGNNPPLNTSYLANPTLISKFINKVLWLKVSLGHFYSSLKSKLAFLGKDDDFFMKRFCEKNNIDYKASINRKNVLYFGLKNVKRILLAPEYLDAFVEKDPINDLYVCLEYNRDEFFTEQYISFKNVIINAKNQGIKIILCSFGTVLNERNNIKVLFLDKLNQAIEGENYTLIVVSKVPNIIKDKNNNVHIFSSVPQLDLLQQCDLMIHHAGMNTIKECLQFQVPMLIYTPKKNSADRLGNAARIKFNSLGVVGNIYKDNSAQIKENIKKAIAIKIPKQNFEEEYNKVHKFIEEELF